MAQIKAILEQRAEAVARFDKAKESLKATYQRLYLLEVQAEELQTEMEDPKAMGSTIDAKALEELQDLLPAAVPMQTSGVAAASGGSAAAAAQLPTADQTSRQPTYQAVFQNQALTYQNQHMQYQMQSMSAYMHQQQQMMAGLQVPQQPPSAPCLAQPEAAPYPPPVLVLIAAAATSPAAPAQHPAGPIAATPNAASMAPGHLAKSAAR